MSISELIRSMAAAGAPPEAIALAVEAIEARDAKIEQRRAYERDKKRRQRAGHVGDCPGTVPGQSGDNAGQSRDTSPLKERSPPIPPSKENNPPHSLSSLRSESEPRAGRASPSEAKEAAQAFDQFWQAWPNKIGKPVAAKAFFKVWREADAIVAGVERYKLDKPPDRPWLNPSTFLNQRRWEDDPAPVAMARAGPSSEKLGFATMLIESLERQNGRRKDPDDFENLPALSFGSVAPAERETGANSGLSGGLRVPDG